MYHVWSGELEVVWDFSLTLLVDQRVHILLKKPDENLFKIFIIGYLIKWNELQLVEDGENRWFFLSNNFCLKWVDENQAKKTLMMNDSKFTDEKGHVATII